MNSLTPHDISTENSKKLDKILMLLEGSGPDAPGLIARIGHMERTLFGPDGAGGIVQKMNVVWRIHLWIMCTASGAVGAGLTSVWHLIFKKP